MVVDALSAVFCPVHECDLATYRRQRRLQLRSSVGVLADILPGSVVSLLADICIQLTVLDTFNIKLYDRISRLCIIEYDRYEVSEPSRIYRSLDVWYNLGT